MSQYFLFSPAFFLLVAFALPHGAWAQDPCGMEYAGIAPPAPDSFYDLPRDLDLKALNQALFPFYYGRVPRNRSRYRGAIEKELVKDPYYAQLSPAGRKAAVNAFVEEPYFPLHTIQKIKWLDRLRAAGKSPGDPVESFAGLARSHGLVTLQHRTEPENVTKILRSGHIAAKARSSSSFGGGENRVRAAYLSAASAETRRVWLQDVARYDSAVIEVSLDVLDSVKWHHAMPIPAAGRDDPIASHRNLSFELYAIQAARTPAGSYNEVVSFHNIPLVENGAIEHVYMRVKAREKTLRQLVRENVKPPEGRTWEEIVVPLER